MLIEELNRLQSAVHNSYSEAGEAFTRSDPNIWNLIKVAEDDLNTYLAAQREYTEGFGSGEIPPDFSYSGDPLDPHRNLARLNAARSDAKRRLEWIVTRLRRIEHLKMNPNIQTNPIPQD
jgi:hypothetical protein